MARNTDVFGAAQWRSSSYSNGSGGLCLEVADGFPGVVPVRDSKRTEGPTLVFPTMVWSLFVAAVADRRH
ncbi:DUF397 domain-containing protein [Streptomyces venezuelae]|uniref:DUF397 domain-containing protein n=1 Tax=Streptomyces venezuelae TaxID=54571 RepID=A0A5P2BZS1_STRVZ|nr:DUF397 domain-containing protein [Streptomyces venezuelae]QES35996.1 DUF397 domain-containing protein [Streptomyces venezuelae]